MDGYENPADAIRRAHEHQMQHIEAHRHEVRRLFTELSQEHLSTLNDFLAIIATSGDQAAGTAAHFHGVAKIYLESRFNICSACGVDHDKAAQELKDKEEESGQQMLPFPMHEHPVILERKEGVPESESPSDPYPDLPKHVKQFMEDSGLTGKNYGPFLRVGESGRLNLPQVKMMSAYYLDDVRSKETGELLGFSCLRCGKPYQSIEDRMLRSPDDCDGCHTKSAWG